MTIDKPNRVAKSLIELMPQESFAKDILSERAKIIASSAVTETAENEQQIHYVSFNLGNHEHYGIPYSFIKEVTFNLVPTPVPHTPKYIKGIINRDGALIAVVDLKQLFKVSGERQASDNHLIVINFQGITLAILVDSINGSGFYEPKNLSSSLQFAGALAPKFITGLHDGVIAIINVEVLMDTLIR